MSRITGSDAKKMFEAYSAVYAPQELTEEQIWEEVEAWVNSLVEEGYDLSEYTWEDMYEAYIEESGENIGSGLRQQFGRLRRSAGDVIGATTQGLLGKTTTSSNPLSRAYNLGARVVSTPTRFAGDVSKGFVTGKGSTPQAKPSTPVSKSALDDKVSYKDPKQLSADAAKDLKNRYPQKLQRLAAQPGRTGDGGGGRNTLPPPKSDGPKTAPTQTSSPKPGTQAAGPSSIKPKTPNPLLAGGDIRRMQQASQMRQKGINVTSNQLAAAERTKPATPTQATAAAPSTSAAASGSVVPAAAKDAATPKPVTMAPRQTARERMLNQSYEYDAYDLVLEYLLDNGHVDTVDEAHYVMLEMEAEVIQDIVEAKYGTKEGRKELAKKIRKGEEVGKSGPGTGFADVEKAAKKGGARDPKAVAAAAMWKTYGK
jgi:hypothetical protein